MLETRSSRGSTLSPVLLICSKESVWLFIAFYLALFGVESVSGMIVCAYVQLITLSLHRASLRQRLWMSNARRRFASLISGKSPALGLRLTTRWFQVKIPPTLRDSLLGVLLNIVAAERETQVRFADRWLIAFARCKYDEAATSGPHSAARGNIERRFLVEMESTRHVPQVQFEDR